MIRVMVLLTAMAFAAPAQAEAIKLAVTTSFENSGLAKVLLPAIQADTGVDVQLLVVGTGQALRLGAAGDVDAVLVHARTAEDAFVAAGYGTHRTEIMYNDFVVLGPSDDPAGLRGTDDAVAALARLAESAAPFVSRGDESGTHKAELTLWGLAGKDPAGFRAWYNAVGAGMGATLNTASGLNAYALSDRATWLNFGNKGDLAVVFEGDARLFNQYTFLPVNPGLHPHVNGAGVAKVEDWLTGSQAKDLINGYRISQEQVFTFNASAQ